MKNKNRRTISVCESVDVDVDIEEYVDDFLEVADDRELIAELKSRGYDVSRTKIASFGTCESENRRFFCDLFGISYYSSNQTLLNEFIKSIQ